MKTYLIESGLDAFIIRGRSVPYLVVYAENRIEAREKWNDIVDDVETNTINYIQEIDYFPDKPK